MIPKMTRLLKKQTNPKETSSRFCVTGTHSVLELGLVDHSLWATVANHVLRMLFVFFDGGYKMKRRVILCNIGKLREGYILVPQNECTLHMAYGCFMLQWMAPKS